MSETDFPREPLTLVEIRTPKCANSYGCSPCKAGLGLVDASDLSQRFADGVGDYVVTNGTVLQKPETIRMTATGPSATLNTGAVTTGFDGTDYRYVVVRGRVITPGATPVFTLGYGSGAAVDAGTTMPAQNISTRFRGVVLNTLTAGEEFVAVFDAQDSADYATEWAGATVDRFALTFYAESGTVVEVYSVQVASLSVFDNRELSCYNTRASCTSVADYQAEALDDRTPDQEYITGETVPSGAFDRTQSIVARFDVFIPINPVGVIWEQGDDTTGLYLGFSGTNLVLRAFDGSVATGEGVAKIEVPASSVAGSTKSLFAEVDWSNWAVSLFEYCPCTKAIRLLGRDSLLETVDLSAYQIDGSDPALLLDFGAAFYGAGTLPVPAFTDWASSATGKIGGVEGTTVVGEDTSDYNGTITSAKFYQGEAGLLFPRLEFDEAPAADTYRLRTILSEGSQAKPADEIYLIPALDDVGTVSTRLNLGGSDTNYEPIGRRATVDFSSPDFTHSGFQQDPYYLDRATQPDSFWLPWMARQKYGRVGASVFLYEGYNGQALADMKTRLYILEKMSWQRDAVSVYCRDALSATEFRKVQIPLQSTGVLEATCLVADTEFVVTGDVTADYDAAGTVRINDEIIQYTSRAHLAGVTTFSGLTRGSDNSEISEHDPDDLVQECLRLVDARIDDVLTDWVVNRARVPAQRVDLAGFTAEYEEYLSAYLLNTLIIEPTGGNELIGDMAQECSFFFWEDERAQKIRMKAIRPLDVDEITTVWTDQANIVAGSLRQEEKSAQRLTALSIYFNPIDYTKDLNKSKNYKNGLRVINGAASSKSQYGDQLQTRKIYSRFLSTEAQANQTATRTSLRYSDTPTELELHVDAKDRELWVGDYVEVKTRAVRDVFGNELTNRYLIIEAEEIVAGDLVRYVLADITLDGRIYRISANDIITYSAVEFAAGFGFITDADGLNPDGTLGATIS